MKATTFLIYLIPLTLASACGDSEESAQVEPGVQAEVEAPDAGYVNPFTGALATSPVTITELPDDPFFVEYRYPGSKVLNVVEVFGMNTAKFSSTDDPATINAYYEKKFTNDEGELLGRLGRFYRTTADGRLERCSVKGTPGGGSEITISN